MIFHPGDVDVGTKTLRQLQAEEDEEEKFQADLKKAVRQSLGSFPTIPAYLLYQPLGLFASVHSCLLSDSAFSPSQDTFFYFRCQVTFFSLSSYLFCDHFGVTLTKALI